MGKPEANFSAECREDVRKLGGVYARIGTSLPSNIAGYGGKGFISLGTRNAPDSLIIHQGFVHLVELKIRGNPTSPGQEKWMDRCFMDGGKPCWVLRKYKRFWRVINFSYGVHVDVTESLQAALLVIMSEDPRASNHSTYLKLISKEN